MSKVAFWPNFLEHHFFKFYQRQKKQDGLEADLTWQLSELLKLT